MCPFVLATARAYVILDVVGDWMNIVNEWKSRAVEGMRKDYRPDKKKMRG